MPPSGNSAFSLGLLSLCQPKADLPRVTSTSARPLLSLTSTAGHLPAFWATPCLLPDLVSPDPQPLPVPLLTTLRLVLCWLFHPHTVPQCPLLPSESGDTRCPEKPVKPVWDWMLRSEVVTGPQRHLWWRRVVTDITPPSSVGSEPLFKLQAKSSPKTCHFPSPFAATSQHAPQGRERGQQCPMQLVGGSTLLTFSSLPLAEQPR